MNATREPSLGDTPEYAPTQDSAERRTDPPHRPESSFEHRRAVAAARKALFGQAQELFIGRYRILNRIGAGGMGEVYLAQDETLERRVAIKRVLGASVNDRAQERLHREAKALARLSHPNVVQVYEIGEHEERTFLAMEFVEGQTLAGWLESEAHDWRAILTQFIDAGRGLAAVHAVGVVHRDFKAENVLMGKDGRARIADFGLAIDDGALPEAPQGPEAPESPEAARADPGESSAASGPRPLPSLGERLSVTGAMVGTIRYMAPEQIRAGHIDARSDQFAFCVALYEALYDGAPFPLGSVAARVEALTNDAPEIPSSAGRRGPPAAIWRALRRGLAHDADARWPSMDALLAELEAVPRRRRRRVVVAAGLVAAGALGLALPQLSGPAEAIDPCATIESELDGVWDADARARVSANFDRADEAARALDALDRWRDGWIDERRAVCRASGRAEADASLERAKLSCLTRQRQRVDALVDALGGAALDDARSARALDVLRTLPEAEACEDDLGASLMEPPPADQRQRVAELQASIDRATDQRRLGDFDAGFELLRSLEPEVELAGYGPLTAEFMAERAKFERTASSLERGVELLADAIDLAEVHRHEQLAGELWLSLAMLSFNELDDPEAGSRQLRRALVTWQRLSPSDSIRARLEFARGIERESLGGADDLEAAREHLRRAIELVESSEAPSADLPHYRGDLARLHADDPKAQLALLRQAVADGERVWGPAHPRTADFQYQLGNALLLRGENEAARELLDAAVIGWSRAGEGMRERAASEHSLAQLALGEGDLDAAETHARALAQMRAAYLPAGHADHGDAPSILAIIAGVRGQHELAIDHAREALRHWESKRDASDPEVLYMRTEIANHAHSLGRVDEAVAAYESILADALPDAGLVLVTAHLGLADLELNRGNVDAAAEQLDAIVALGLPSLEPQTLTFTVLRALVALRQGEGVAASLAAVRAARKDSALSSEQLHAWIDGLTLSDAERDALRGALD